MALELNKEALAKSWKIFDRPMSYLFYKAWGTAAEMLADRLYDIDENDFDISYDDFVAEYCHDGIIHPQDLTIICTLPHPDCSKVCVIFLGAATLSLETFHEMSEVAEKEDLRRVIIVFDNHNLTSEAFERILDTCPFKVEIFHIYELFCNIARGALQVRYRMITADEKKKLFFNNTQLIKLNPKYVVSRYFALERGVILHLKEHQTPPMKVHVQADDQREGNADEEHSTPPMKMHVQADDQREGNAEEEHPTPPMKMHVQADDQREGNAEEEHPTPPMKMHVQADDQREGNAEEEHPTPPMKVHVQADGQREGNAEEDAPWYYYYDSDVSYMEEEDWEEAFAEEEPREYYCCI